MNPNNCISPDAEGAELPKLTKRQRKSRKYRHSRLDYLVKTWPQTFDLKNPRPLAEDILEQLSAELNAIGSGGHGSLRYVLNGYIRHMRYIRALVAGGARYDLYGNPAGEVTAEQQEQAAQLLKTMKENKVMFTDEVNL